MASTRCTYGFGEVTLKVLIFLLHAKPLHNLDIVSVHFHNLFLHGGCNTLIRYFSECIYIKGIVHLNIIFSYMKVNKICNLDHPVY